MARGGAGLHLNVRLEDGDPCGVLDDLLAGSYDPNDPLQMAETTNSAWRVRPCLGAVSALAVLACLPILPLLRDGQPLL